MNLQVLTKEQVETIHNASLRILSEVGVDVPHEQMKASFRDAGAKVDDASDRVRIPAELVVKSLASATKSFTIYGRDKNKTAVFGEGKRNYNSISGEALWLDDKTGERRYATMEDVKTAARLGDALENISIVGAMSDPHEMPVSYRSVEVAVNLLKNTTKPIGFWYYDKASTRYLIELFTLLRGSTEEARKYPVSYPFFEPISPLRFPFLGIDLLYETAKLNLPVPIGPMAQVGISAPGTLAGTVAQENAEILAGICITQLVQPGMPVCYGGIPHAFDMRTTQMIFCGPEQALMATALTQLGKFRYGLPVYINVGLSDSKSVDAQAGIETGITLTCGALAGADIFGHMGICGVDQATSLDLLVMQNELIGYVERIMRGVDVDADTIAAEVISKVGPGGTFIDQEHTAEHFRHELWFPKLLDRQFYDAWMSSGSKTMAQRCRERKEALLQGHEVVPIADDMAKEMDKLVDAARRDLTKH